MDEMLVAPLRAEQDVAVLLQFLDKLFRGQSRQFGTQAATSITV
jgi:hypothetical protein